MLLHEHIPYTLHLILTWYGCQIGCDTASVTDEEEG